MITGDGVLRLAPWSVPRLVIDVRADSGGDGPLGQETALPGRLLIEAIASWRNDTPVDHTAMIQITRRYKKWITTNPNAVQFRDRWTTAIDGPAEPPVTSGIFNGQVGSAVDLSTNTVAEPYPGIFEHWWGTSTADEWIGPVEPGSELNVWYRCYVWTPPPWSDNANASSPVQWAEAGWSRIQMMVFPAPGKLVTG